VTEMPWGQLVKMGLGVVNIPPSEFWEMSLPELYMAIEGFKDFHATEQEGPMTKEELHELMELYPD
tara:strand:- start:18 stop:215 length:198 start_codon:yes stop_codon:yes gene_type:complete